MRRTRFWTGVTLPFLLLAAAACAGESSFQGTELDPSDVAPPFHLSDQFGHHLGLQDMAGKVVVLTFLYTYCPDVCPIATETLRRAHQLLGNDASQVEFVAVSVDPRRDSVERAYRYSQEKGMQDRWRFLVGTEEQLAPVWQAYWLDPIRDVSDRRGDSPDSDHPEEPGDAEAHAQAVTAGGPGSGGYTVSHTAPVFLIDRQGCRRVIFTSLSLDPEPLVNDIRILLR